VLFVCLAVSGCIGNAPKTVSKKSTIDPNATAVTDADSFSITFAYRDGSNAANRTVQLQGVRSTSASLTDICGTSGTSCTCDFYQLNADGSVNTASPTSAAATVGISKDNNSFTCSISGAVAASNFAKVRLRTIDGLKSTGFIDVSNSLTLQQVIGDISPKQINKVYKYTCSKTFFEGEGVSTSSITCDLQTLSIAQHLGLITAYYDYYLYTNQTSGFNASQFQSSFWPAICSRSANEFTIASCGASPQDLRYGLSNVAAGPFQIKVTLTRAPQQDSTNAPLSAAYGYAASPDTSGNCPTGLVAARPYQARPASITTGSIDGTNPTSNFINIGDGTINNTVVETTAPANFQVQRQPSATACQLGGPTPGSCVGATFGGSSTVQSVAYSAMTPIICVIPKDLLSGI
jgi:hypothetical protein